ncbi:hypothetical protein SAMN05444422_107227 [Halobiforma haloterrestris]|uniref:DUF8135 domain-containing protein n=1 Tax=Natronobacterium haloterrestre TaxID=148448 RepID=A0A1I1ILB3_NATHA|nr:hypothetical protein [Halobiforma haloterrestris]SFC36751.1 hypothetical protein SAMN05444422_107227 [Halobiforma haloterrestris]
MTDRDADDGIERSPSDESEDGDGNENANSRTVRPTLRDDSGTEPGRSPADRDGSAWTDPDAVSDSRPEGSSATGPLGDLAATVERRRTEAADPATGASSDEFDDLFDREDVAELDPDRLWERLEDDAPPADLFEEEREIRTVDKREYCHQCEHFATPPNVGCTLEGTDVLDMPRLDQFRVADCPVVLEDEELERRY